MKALTIRQPWAWSIIHAGKDIENRDWATKFRGRFLVHAAKGMTREEYEETCEFFEGLKIEPPPLAALQWGGIIGIAELVDCVEASASPWFFGRYGFVLRDPKPMEFIPCKGALGWWAPSADVLAMVARQVAP